MNHNATIELANGYKISRILKGGWQLSAGHSATPIDKSKSIDDMFAFVQAGITTFDFGDIYTGVEETIGEFLKNYAKKYGRKSLADIQTHTKFVPDLDFLPYVTKEFVQKGIDRSLKRLGVERIDLVQYHHWNYEVPNYIETLHYLKELQKKGKIRLIGVTNFDKKRLKEIVKSGVCPVSNQVQYSVLDHRPEHEMVDFCRKHDIKLLCYGTAAGGFLSERYLEASELKEPFENRSLTKYKLIIDDFGGHELFKELLSALDKIAKKHGVSLTNVATKYVLQKPQVAGVIIGARNTNHLHDNLRVYEFELDSEDLHSVDEVVKKAKGPKGDIYGLERVKDGKHAVIMKYNLNRVK